MLPTKDKIRKLYVDYAEQKLFLINQQYGRYLSENNSLNHQYNAVQTKTQHGLSMMDGVEKATVLSNMFNETYQLSAAIEGCLHDIGRFEQFVVSGTLIDRDSEPFTGVIDHGIYGKILLLKNNKELLRYFLEQSSPYDHILTEIIGEHTKVTNPEYMLSITQLANIFNNYSFEEVINSNCEDIINKLIALKLKVLREIDSLEILQNVISGIWKPLIGYENIYHANREIFEKFKNFEKIDMKSWKEAGKWTPNSGFLLRYGLLTYNVNFVGTLKQFIEQDGFTKIFDQTKANVTNDNGEYMILNDPLLFEAQEYIKIAVKNLIETSDGVLITPESREEAKQLTLKMYK